MVACLLTAGLGLSVALVAFAFWHNPDQPPARPGRSEVRTERGINEEPEKYPWPGRAEQMREHGKTDGSEVSEGNPPPEGPAPGNAVRRPSLPTLPAILPRKAPPEPPPSYTPNEGRWLGERPAVVPQNEPADLVALDTTLRARFDQQNPDSLPERKRKKLAEAGADRFDWVQVYGGKVIHFQGIKPNCTTHAVVAALEWNWQIRNGILPPALSPQPIIDRTQKREFTAKDVLDEVLLHGTTTLADYPYTGEPQQLRNKPMPYRIIGWGAISMNENPSVKSVKEALLEHGPLVTSVYSSPAFKAYRGGVFAEHLKVTGDKPTNHAVVIIGWDDRLGRGCWHIQNSWSLQWGEGGGMWIEYGCNNIGRYTCWLRCQPLHYDLPPDAHTMVRDGADPFPPLRRPDSPSLRRPDLP